MSPTEHFCPQCGRPMKRTESKDAHGPLHVFNCSPCGVSYFEAPKSGQASQ